MYADADNTNIIHWLL